jgi:hypothetical protein
MKKYLIAGDRLEAPELLREIRQPDGVVQDPAAPVVVAVGSPDDADDRQVLAERPRDGVDGAEPADGEGDGARAHPAVARPGVAVGGVGRVELVAAADEAHPCGPALRLELVEEREVEVPRHREDVARADLRQPPRQVPAQRGVVRRGVGEGGVRDRRGVGGRRDRSHRGVHRGGAESRRGWRSFARGERLGCGAMARGRNGGTGAGSRRAP